MKHKHVRREGKTHTKISVFSGQTTKRGGGKTPWSTKQNPTFFTKGKKNYEKGGWVVPGSDLVVQLQKKKKKKKNCVCPNPTLGTVIS